MEIKKSLKAAIQSAQQRFFIIGIVVALITTTAPLSWGRTTNVVVNEDLTASVVKKKKGAKKAHKKAPKTVVILNNEPPLLEAEEMPRFAGGDLNTFRFWCGKNVEYPQQAALSGTQGTVTLSFIVECDGSVTNIKIVQGVDNYLNSEAIRVVQLSPKWTPGKNGGKPVRIMHTIPVVFMLR